MLSGARHGASREKRRRVPLDVSPRIMQQAVLAIEDRRFYGHPGIDPIRDRRRLVTNVRGNLPLPGRRKHHHAAAGPHLLPDATRWLLEQQTGQRSQRRKVLEQFMALILETKRDRRTRSSSSISTTSTSGNRGSFALHGVAEAARMFFGKDVSNLVAVEAALDRRRHPVAGQSLALRDPERAKERRNVVLPAMADAGYMTRRCGGAGDERADDRAAARASTPRRPTSSTTSARPLQEQLRRASPAARGARRLHDARPQPAAVRAGSRARRARARSMQMLPGASGPAARAGGARRHRSAHRRGARARRRALLQPVAVQPRDQRAPAARLGLQAVRLPGRLRAGARRKGAPI